MVDLPPAARKYSSFGADPKTPRRSRPYSGVATAPGGRRYPKGRAAWEHVRQAYGESHHFSCGAPHRSSPAQGVQLQAPHVVEATEPHYATVILLHGFCSSGKELANSLLAPLKDHLSMEVYSRIRFVFLNAPRRKISCFAPDAAPQTAWHDYFTDHGGDEGRPELEEKINVDHLRWCRKRIHRALDEELSRLGGDASRLALFGSSQGCCTAVDAALTYHKRLAGVFASFGQVYACTPIPQNRTRLRIHTFNGAADRVIAASLALRSYSKLIDAGFHELQMHVEPKLGHCESSDAEISCFSSALLRWGFDRPPSQHLDVGNSEAQDEDTTDEATDAEHPGTNGHNDLALADVLRSLELEPAMHHGQELATNDVLPLSQN
ncbi:hypothetical protein AB1Y20_002821 [Prymnesium parvum]|uniref:Phospholipase/carboxylesterase/thioesterase domain-containing protein n=1 Tax=Prymnesium parvum TaxID=97485 RepID=A0AB34JBQ1_PRYPA